jgi:hypothetical protein
MKRDGCKNGSEVKFWGVLVGKRVVQRAEDQEIREGSARNICKDGDPKSKIDVRVSVEVGGECLEF